MKTAGMMAYREDSSPLASQPARLPFKELLLLPLNLVMDGLRGIVAHTTPDGHQSTLVLRISFLVCCFSSSSSLVTLHYTTTNSIYYSSSFAPQQQQKNRNKERKRWRRRGETLLRVFLLIKSICVPAELYLPPDRLMCKGCRGGGG